MRLDQTKFIIINPSAMKIINEVCPQHNELTSKWKEGILTRAMRMDVSELDKVTLTGDRDYEIVQEMYIESITDDKNIIHAVL